MGRAQPLGRKHRSGQRLAGSVKLHGAADGQTAGLAFASMVAVAA